MKKAEIQRGPKILPNVIIPDALKKALKYTFVNEGGYSDVAGDSGGATSGFGIIISELSRWRGYSVSKQEVRDMPEEEANQIYYFWYWKPLELDSVNAANVSCAIFDIGVVRGIGYPPKQIQLICNDHGNHLAVDRHMGHLTLAALNAMDPSVFLRDFSSRVEAGFRAIVANNSTQAKFLKGWVNRARRLLTLIGAK